MDKDISLEDIWYLLEQEGMDKILGITKEEFYVICSLAQRDNTDIVQILEAYRAFKKYGKQQ